LNITLVKAGAPANVPPDPAVRPRDDPRHARAVEVGPLGLRLAQAHGVAPTAPVRLAPTRRRPLLRGPRLDGGVVGDGDRGGDRGTCSEGGEAADEKDRLDLHGEIVVE